MPFQLLLTAVAGEKLPVLELNTMEAEAFQSVLRMVRASGYQPHPVHLDDFLFEVTPEKAGRVFVPLSGQLDEKTIAILNRYTANGGQLILSSPLESPDPSVSRLLRQLGIQASGSAFASGEMNFQWKGQALAEPDALPAGSLILTTAPSSQAQVLATWGSDYPAIISTDKGVLLNWPWGRQFSAQLNRQALTRVLGGGSETEIMQAKAIQKELPQPTSEATAVASAKPAALPAVPEQPVAPPMPVLPPHKADAAGEPEALPGMGDAAETSEDEVLNNILGTDEPESVAKPRKQVEEKQKHFSFLDPEAKDVLAPDFDYGVYSVSLRILEDYRQRINDALETSRQLALGLPEDKIKALQRESHQHKKNFETLYLANKTQEGLNEFAQAKKLALQALELATLSPKVEGRAIWLDRGTIVDAGSPAGLKALMQKLHQAGINIVYFETLNAGFPIYPSKILKPNPLVNNWDPLQTAVEEGHRLGMEVHAWVWVFAVGNRRHNPLVGMPDDYPGPVLEDAGLMSEALRNRNGGLTANRRQHEFWLSPASPKARQFLLDVYKEIVTTYDVDGLQLDYIRYPFQAASNRMGYEPVGRQRFQQSTGMSLDGLSDYSARVWIAWKTYQVSSFVQQVSETLKAIKPGLKLSAAVFPMKRDSRIVAIQQDWETWVDNGWIDTLSPMSYTTDPQRLQSMYEYVQSSPQKHVLIYPGIALKRLDGGELMRHLEALREKGSLGATLFAGAHLDAEKVEALGQGSFKDRASLTPHSDVIQSLLTITRDYDRKFNKLKTEGALSTLDTQQVLAVQEAISQFSNSLSLIGPGKLAEQIPPFKLQQAQAQLQALKTATTTWTSLDQAAHPFRADYFERTVLLLNKLMGYLSDRIDSAAGAIAARKSAGANGDGFNPASVAPAPVSSSPLDPEPDEEGMGFEDEANEPVPQG